MNPLYDYDVFLSFATKDQEPAKEIWQTLTQGGLRVFWSTSTLKEAVGKSFVTAIQESLVKSQHFVLFWTAQAKASAWVDEECQTFYSQCYIKDKTSRRFVILPDGQEPITSLPPFFRNIQIAGSARELVALLGGIDLQQIQQENRELRRQVDRLREENGTLRRRVDELAKQPPPETGRAEMDRLKAQLGTAQEEIERLRRRLEERPVPVSEPRPEIVQPGVPLDEAAIQKLIELVGKIELESGIRGGLTEKGAFQIWKKLYAERGGGAIEGLCSLLGNPRLDWKDHWRAITLLTYASRTPEGRRRADQILSVVADLVLVAGYVGQAALELIAGAPIAPRLKWECLFHILEAAPIEKSGALLRKLPEFTPLAERDRTVEVIAEILMYANDSSIISNAISAIKALNGRGAAPRLREIVAEAPVDKANQLAEVLAYFGDRDSAPAIRGAIETWRYGQSVIWPLVASLQTLEGEACYPYLAEVLADGHPQLQKNLLSSGALPKSSHEAIVGAVKRLAAQTENQELKGLAEKYLASLTQA